MADQKQSVKELRAEIVGQLQGLTLPQLIELERFIDEEITEEGALEVIAEDLPWAATTVAAAQS